MAIDNSDGPYSGRLYLSYTASESEGFNFFDVFLTYSDDRGLTWSDPKIVHSDNSLRVQQFYSSLFVNDQGVLILDWYDRLDPGRDTDFLMGISFDGGESFTEIKLNSETMDFDWVILAGTSFGIGEYHQLVASDHMAISFWSDCRSHDGDLNIYYAKVSIDNLTTSVVESGLIRDDFEISKTYPHPVSDQFHVEFSLKEKKDLYYENIGCERPTSLSRHEKEL